MAEKAIKLKNNALVWRHPDKGGGLLLTHEKPHENQRTYPFDGVVKQVYLFKETDKDYKRVPYLPELPDNNITPQDCYDSCDWACAKRYLAHRSKFAQLVKIGALITITALCLFAFFLIVTVVAGGNG